MKSFDFEAVAYDGEVFCVDCLPDDVDGGSEGVMPIFADSEWDYAPVCCICGEKHEYMTILSEEDEKCDRLWLDGQEV
jgi:hypothetical protein